MTHYEYEKGLPNLQRIYLNNSENIFTRFTSIFLQPVLIEQPRKRISQNLWLRRLPAVTDIYMPQGEAPRDTATGHKITAKLARGAGAG